MPTANELSARTGPTTDKHFVRDYTRVFEVIFADSETPSGFAANVATGVSLFSQHPEDSLALCINFDPRHEEGDDRYWKVRLDYSSKIEIAEDGLPQSQSHPLERKGRIRLSGRKWSEAMTRDAAFTLIRNSALDPYEHVVERTRLCIQIQRNMPLNSTFGGKVFNPLFIEEYLDYTTNSLPFMGFALREVILDDLDAEPHQEEGQAYWDVNALFVINRIKYQGEQQIGGWVSRKLDAGFRELVSGAWVPIIETGGQRASKPVLLDGFGRKLAPGTPAAPATPIFNNFYDRRLVDYNLIGLLT